MRTLSSNQLSVPNPKHWRQKQRDALKRQIERQEMLSMVGRRLLIIGSLVLVGSLLSGCLSDFVIRKSCDPYPALPKELDQPPKNLDLVPKSLLPSAKSESTTPSSTLPK